MKYQTKTLQMLSVKSLAFALIFVFGNIALPQLAHFMPNGGKIFLPIYFFTLIAAFRYGWQVGVFVAISSPLINYLLFGMPTLAILPVLLVKSVLLAVSAALLSKTKLPLLVNLTLVVLSYQFLGGIFEWAYTGSFASATQDFTLGFAGMLIQVFGSFAVLKLLKKHNV